VRVGQFKAVFNLRGDDGQATGGLAVESNLGWKGQEKYVATVLPGIRPLARSSGTLRHSIAAIFRLEAQPLYSSTTINDSLHLGCWRSFNSLRNVRQISNQTSCSSQSRSRRQQVEGEGNSTGKSHQRGQLRRIHKMPCSTLRYFGRRSSAVGRFAWFWEQGPDLFPLGIGQQPTGSRHRPSLGC
jgi:hypothetical protein